MRKNVAYVVDPFSRSGQSLIYRSDEQYAVLYSVRQDGTDHGYTISPPGDEAADTITELRNSNIVVEGYRIPLWKPVRDEDASGVPDNVQD